MKPVCLQINWQRQVGGGEVYTRFLTQALLSLGWEVVLVVDRKAAFWQQMIQDGVHLIPFSHGRDIPHVLPQAPAVVITHNVLPAEMARAIASQHRLGGLLHMPMSERRSDGLPHYHRLFPVSAYVRSTALARGLHQVHEEPLLGVADLAPRGPKGGTLVRRSEYDWDLRKWRDRLLSWVEPARGLLPRGEFSRRRGMTLGIVSRLTPIKQFPLLFSHIAPILADYPDVYLEVFGSGGYASVRDLRKALTPIAGRSRFWGHQPDPAAVYPQLDYVLSGLPEKEALGLNLIEAQAAGTPVIAVDAPPFVETVVPDVSGFLYSDPRRDGGAGFRELMDKLKAGASRPDPRQASEHLQKFSPLAFRDRVAHAMASLAA